MSTESSWRERYKASKPDPTHIHTIIGVVMSAAFGHQFNMHRSTMTGVDFTVGDIWCRIDILPERKTMWSPEWREGLFNHNGRWKLELSCPTINPVTKRPTDKQVKAAVEEFVSPIKTAMERLRMRPGPPKLTLVVNRP